MQKTRARTVSTLHVGRFRAREVLLECKPCGRTYRSEGLSDLVPAGSNFGYDVMVYAGKALWQRHRTEAEVITELAEKNVRISPREVSYLGMRFVTYLAIDHQRRAPDIKADMQSRGGYVCHLDATCEGRDPFLMSSIDSLSDIVLGNIKLPSEDKAHIIPFLERIKKAFGVPAALVHDMSKGILAAVAFAFAPVVGAYTLIQWTLKGKTEGNGYGFPFDRPHLSFAQRLRNLNTQIDRIKDMGLPQNLKWSSLLADIRTYFERQASS